MIFRIVEREVCKNKKWGFIDKNRELIIPLQYRQVYDFSEGLAQAQRFGKFTLNLIDQGEDKLDYQECYEESKSGWGLIDKDGNEVVSMNYSKVDEFFDGYAYTWSKDGQGYIIHTGIEFKPFIFEFANIFSEGLAGIRKNNKWGFIDKTGNVVIPIVYNDVHEFSEGLASV